MRPLDYLTLALRNLARRKARTLLTVSAVVIGAISVTVMMSLVIAGKKAFIGSMADLGILTNITVTASSEIKSDSMDVFKAWSEETGKPLTDDDLAKLKTLTHVVGASPISSPNFNYVYLQGKPNSKYRAEMIALDPTAGVMEMPVIAGRALQATDMNKVVIGGSLTKYLGFSDNPAGAVGEKLVAWSNKGGGYTAWDEDPPLPPENADKEYWEKLNSVQHSYEMEIVGVMGSGPNERMNFINLAWAKKLLTQKRWEWNEEKQKQLDQQQTSGPRQVSNREMYVLVEENWLEKRGYGSIMLKVDDTNNVEMAAAAIEKDGYGVTTAQETIDQFMNIFSILGYILGGIGGIALFVATIGIINTMVMATYERIREIGVMRSCGATRATVRRLFMFEAAWIGLSGGLIGLGISYLMAKIANYLLNREATNLSLPLENLITFPWWLVLGVLGITTFLGLIAGIVPAIKAARLDPVEALRYE